MPQKINYGQRSIRLNSSVPKECHMILDKWHSGLYNYVVVNMRLLSAVTTNKNLYYFSYMREPAAVGFFIIL